MFDPTRHIAITGVDMRTFIMVVYELSEEKGFGQVMVRSGLLENEMIELIMAGHRQRLLGGCNPVLHMDDVHGRKCSMMVYRDGEMLYIPRIWYGHSDEKLRILLKRCGIRDTRAPEPAFSTENLGGVSHYDDTLGSTSMPMPDVVSYAPDIFSNTDTFSGGGGDFGGGGASGDFL